MSENLLDRRRFLKLTGGAAVTALAVQTLWREAATADELDPAPFTLGVASGDPDHTSVVLWTRLAPDPGNGGGMPDRDVPVRWEVALDENFRHVMRRGEATARPGDAHSVHAIADRLAPNRWYWYRFEAEGVRSRVGRTRTLPTPGSNPDTLRFAVASCQNWVGGPYPAYRDMAEHDLDLVLHLGDYIYETQNGSLDEFRRLHSLYKTSPDLREAHARFPFVTTWDDHEVLNNWSRDDDRSPDGLPFTDRRANGFQAYYEHLPMRTMPDGPDYPIYRGFRWGRLAEFSVLDTRQYRDDQACGDGMNKPPCDDVYDEDRTMTGPEQERWLIDRLRESKARWNVLAQQTILASFDYDVGPGLAYNLDQWDGYPAARQRLLDAIVEHEPSNPVVLSGDWHSHWVNDILADFSDPSSAVLASEFVGTSISSGIGWDDAVRQGLPANPHVKFYNGSYRGYVHCEVTPERWQTTLRIVTDPRSASSPAYTIASYEVRDGEPGPRRLDEGDGFTGTVVSAADDEPLRNAEILVRRDDGSVALRVWTDASGEYLSFLAPGSYRLEAHAVGYESASMTLDVDEGAPPRADFSLARVAGVYAGTGRRVPGPNAEGVSDDLVLGNGLLAMAVSKVTNDGQLPNATPGKPIDMAAAGHLDQIDWFNLPYVAASAPAGTEGWQQGLVRSASVDVESAGPERGVARAAGAALEVPDVSVATMFTVEPGQPWILAESVLTNTGAESVTVWAGDVIDHDGPGQRSGVPGHGTITTPYGDPGEFVPDGSWIGMTGTDGQTYALLYDDAEFTAYGNGNWIQSRWEVTLAAGESWTLRRRIAAVDNGGDADPWA
ncbi:alkaline phosphatase D family protein, partial [Phytoactinopolyspora endophytica]|uniref:alkaline phosphatase D family protein n=1 Tax=Phytoactinopolyspora endophytica TaxID=1642495 RepID=UPI00101BBC9E